RRLVTTHRHLALVGTQVGAKLRLNLRPASLRDEAAEFLADNLLRSVAKESLGGGVIGTDDQAVVNGDDAVSHVVENCTDPVAAPPQFLLGPTPLDKVPDLTAD